MNDKDMDISEKASHIAKEWIRKQIHAEFYTSFFKILPQEDFK